MKVKKLLINILLISSIVLIFTGCRSINNENIKVNIFNSAAAMDVAKEYVDNISKGEISKANELCAQELLNENKVISEGTSKIMAYNVEKLIESYDSIYVMFNVLRSSNREPKCDLDSFAIKVSKVNDEYKITEVKAVNKKQIFVKDNGLRLIEDGAGTSQLVVSLSNMAKDVYPRDNKIMIYKQSAPTQEFGIISLSYTGQKIAISTIGDGNAFISIGYLDESTEVQGEVAEAQSSNEAKSNQDLQDLLEKPIAKKIVAVDILKNVEIENMIFSQEENNLIVEYTEKSAVKRVKIYKTEDGELVSTNIDNMFPNEKYNVVLDGLDKNSIYINVSAIEENNYINTEILGTYKVDLEKLDIIKK